MLFAFGVLVSVIGMAFAYMTPCGQKIKTAGKTRGYPIPA
jgi:hypothetical protein